MRGWCARSGRGAFPGLRPYHLHSRPREDDGPRGVPTLLLRLRKGAPARLTPASRCPSGLGPVYSTTAITVSPLSHSTACPVSLCPLLKFLMTDLLFTFRGLRACEEWGEKLLTHAAKALRTGEAAFKSLQETDPELSPEERRIQERKLKKERKKEERKRLREASIKAQTRPAQRSGAELALDYLCGSPLKAVPHWRTVCLSMQASDHFGEVVNLVSSAMCSSQASVPSEHFPTLLAYLEGLRGQARELTVQKAEAMMQELDKEGTSDLEPLLQEKVQRVRQVLQLLS
ncbi:putative protein C7orf50 [Galemys pyrenaicus]|uniref:WKF domain-containing protein n=1 Tax=Galemys pyrenaicus TaxID=202257 RepID=A0A8J6A3I3_GALPY|nr:putative protein C7orf50 [Galemys pyrenaicus]